MDGLPEDGPELTLACLMLPEDCPELTLACLTEDGPELTFPVVCPKTVLSPFGRD